MHSRLLQVGILSAIYVSTAICSGQAISDEVTTRRWYQEMNEGRFYHVWGEPEQAQGFYDEALSLAPSEEHKADTMLYMARAYEGMYLRSDAIAMYKRILELFPETQYAPRIYFRLGELHTSITLLPPGTSHEELSRLIQEEMIPSKSVPYFEKGVAAGSPLNPWVLSSRIYLAGLYMETGRDGEAWGILHELANLNLYDLKVSDYIGPYIRMNDPRRTQGQRVDDARVRAARVRHSAQKRLVAWSVVPEDHIQSLANLRALMDMYSGTEIESLARQEEARILEIMQQETSVLVEDLLEEIIADSVKE